MRGKTNSKQKAQKNLTSKKRRIGTDTKKQS